MRIPSDAAESRHASRREFLAHSGALVGATAVAGLSLTRSAHAAGTDTFKVGLIGCGGRGSGAAANAMNAGKDIQLVAMGDIFEEKLKASRANLQKIKPDQVAVPDDRCFVGFDAYQKVIDSGVDVVIIACTSHFHPRYLQAAVDAGKHVFCEKPHSLDVPGLKRVKATCEEAEKKGLAVVSGLCWRYHLGLQETIKRIHDGMIGDIVAIQETYVCSPYRADARRDPKWSEMEWQLRNWYHFNWLAGDQILQQLIHSIDKGAWVLHDQPPVKAWGMGGRSNCFGPSYGDLFDHQTIVYEYANGVRMYGLCRNHVGCHDELSDTIFGTKGVARLANHYRIEGETPWRYEGPNCVMTDQEHMALFDSIRNGRPINNGHYMFGSTMLALLGQFVCNTGQEITWEKALTSQYSVELERYGFDVPPPLQPNQNGDYDIPVPGITKFI
jgi:myo-inositol 2-dehydrogenase / D-chiro-inositol 1-dehydrogenase